MPPAIQDGDSGAESLKAGRKGLSGVMGYHDPSASPPARARLIEPPVPRVPPLAIGKLEPQILGSPAHENKAISLGPFDLPGWSRATESGVQTAVTSSLSRGGSDGNSSNKTEESAAFNPEKFLNEQVTQNLISFGQPPKPTNPQPGTESAHSTPGVSFAKDISRDLEPMVHADLTQEDTMAPFDSGRSHHSVASSEAPSVTESEIEARAQADQESNIRAFAAARALTEPGSLDRQLKDVNAAFDDADASSVWFSSIPFQAMFTKRITIVIMLWYAFVHAGLLWDGYQYVMTSGIEIHSKFKLTWSHNATSEGFCLPVTDSQGEETDSMTCSGRLGIGLKRHGAALDTSGARYEEGGIGEPNSVILHLKEPLSVNGWWVKHRRDRSTIHPKPRGEGTEVEPEFRMYGASGEEDWVELGKRFEGFRWRHQAVPTVFVESSFADTEVELEIEESVVYFLIGALMLGIANVFVAFAVLCRNAALGKFCFVMFFYSSVPVFWLGALVSKNYLDSLALLSHGFGILIGVSGAFPLELYYFPCTLVFGAYMYCSGLILDYFYEDSNHLVRWQKLCGGHMMVMPIVFFFRRRTTQSALQMVNEDQTKYNLAWRKLRTTEEQTIMELRHVTNMIGAQLHSKVKAKLARQYSRPKPNGSFKSAKKYSVKAAIAALLQMLGLEDMLASFSVFEGLMPWLLEDYRGQTDCYAEFVHQLDSVSHGSFVQTVLQSKQKMNTLSTQKSDGSSGVGKERLPSALRSSGSMFLLHSQKALNFDVGDIRTRRPIRSLDQLYAQAQLLVPFLNAQAMQWARVTHGVVPEGQEGGVTWSKLKKPRRAIEKTLRSYRQDPSYLVDICRQSIIFFRVGDLCKALRTIIDDPDAVIVRCKNRMSPSFNAASSAGYRDVCLNLRIVNQETLELGIETHVCELQLLHVAFAEVKSDSGHKAYVQFRNTRCE